jgi:protein-L-isoaspartate(D-aspartate) O-methyltransferase
MLVKTGFKTSFDTILKKTYDKQVKRRPRNIHGPDPSGTPFQVNENRAHGMKKMPLWSSVLLILLLATPASGGNACSDQDREKAFSAGREKMVEGQLKVRGLRDSRVLTAMGQVRRHCFVPAALQDQAYGDHPLPIGSGQTISQPYIVALMSELLELKGKEKVLEVGTGSGYQAAVLAELTAQVYTIEIVPSLAFSAKERLLRLGVKNVSVRAGDGYLGWPEEAPFDAIMVTAAPDHIPGPLVEQLKEGGRMILPVGTYPYQELKKGVKRSGKLTVTDVLPVLFVPMTGDGVRQKR